MKEMAAQYHVFAALYWFNFSPCCSDAEVRAGMCQYIVTSLLSVAAGATHLKCSTRGGSKNTAFQPGVKGIVQIVFLKWGWIEVLMHILWHAFISEFLNKFSQFQKSPSPWGTPVLLIHKLNGCQTDNDLYCCPLLNMTFTIYCARPDE